MDARLRLLIATDRALGVLLGTALAGSVLAFGGAVWWARPALAGLTFLIALAALARVLLQRSWRALKSPLLPLGLLAWTLAAVQLVPLPARLAGWVSPRARAVHDLGLLPDRARLEDPSVELPGSGSSRSPATLDRSATLRWLGGATVCLALFAVVAHYVHRLGHLLVIWGSLVAAFLLNTTFGVVQVASRAPGLYGSIAPGNGPPWAPSTADLLDAPGASVLRPLDRTEAAGASWALPQPVRPFLIGSLMGGPGAYLALGSLCLPLSLGLALQLMAPRGSREGLVVRLRHARHGSLVILLTVLTLASAVLTGVLAGPLLCVPFVLGVALVGLPSAWPSGLRWTGLALTLGTLAALLGGVALGTVVGPSSGVDPLADPTRTVADWATLADQLRIVREFPLLGSGLGTFPSIAAYFKSRDLTTTVALSSALQWWIEAGAVGLGIVGLAGLWAAWKLPGALRRVGTADRSLAFALVGSVVCFAGFSLVHWTVELLAVAMAASAVGGICQRWLAGGTDLFVEPA